jgi:hypothetical protein
MKRWSLLFAIDGGAGGRCGAGLPARRHILFSACAGEGVAAEGALEARLTFPEICFDGACCDLSNPTRLRGLPDQFLYDGACTADGRRVRGAHLLRHRAGRHQHRHRPARPGRDAAPACPSRRWRMPEPPRAPAPLTFGPPVIHPRAQPPKDAWPMNLFRRYPHRRDRRAGRDDARGRAARGAFDLDNVTVEPPRDAAHGDMATNAAMVLAKPAGRSRATSPRCWRATWPPTPGSPAPRSRGRGS